MLFLSFPLTLPHQKVKVFLKPLNKYIFKSQLLVSSHQHFDSFQLFNQLWINIDEIMFFSNFGYDFVR